MLAHSVVKALILISKVDHNWSQEYHISMLKGLDKEIQVQPHRIGQRVLIYSVTVWSRVCVILTPGINNNSINSVTDNRGQCTLEHFYDEMKSFLDIIYTFQSLLFCIKI